MMMIGLPMNIGFFIMGKSFLTCSVFVLLSKEKRTEIIIIIKERGESFLFTHIR
jgi:hypothetical protein